ncbi:alpha/beta hydrolase family protein [Chitinophaga rhizophila]|uniref:Prolyl oligopeptidase family serine peptidase n=1 Tax=Chitinophaga rhizophila TaxID=2866212 RepID=A0ABS7GN10_9BACT|nr:prolyl oligopeptidase family serine peptidase [Chitinophaga rhizophila]MBW8688153.1 prolyl oligopeptidase family serine peptidase [Chitinophaga rhizophila]
MRYTLILLLLVLHHILVAQKPPITNMTYKSWETLLHYNISDDGRYVWYTYGSELTGTSLVVRAVKGNYSKIFTGVLDAAFTADSRHLVFVSKQGLAVLPVGGTIATYDQRFTHYKLPERGTGQWLAARQADTLVLKDLHHGKEYCYTGVRASLFNKAGDVLVLNKKDSLLWIDLHTMQAIGMSGGDNVLFDHSDTAVAFTSGVQPEVRLRYYRKGMNSACDILPGSLPDLANMGLQFSKDNKSVFFRLLKAKAATPPPATSKVRVWDYRDVRLQSQTAPDEYSPFTAKVPVTGGPLVRLENIDTSLVGMPGDRYALVSNVVNDEDAYWNDKQVKGYDLVSLADGSKRHVVESPQRVAGIQLSPGERFVVWFDVLTKQYFSYEIHTGIRRNISKGVRACLAKESFSRMEIQPAGSAGWLANDQRLLVYDAYDIWQLDPMGKVPPVNITNYYGVKHQTILRMVYPQLLSTQQLNDPVLIACLDSDKRNGFMQVKLGTNTAIAPATMEPVAYHFPALVVFEPSAPVKAKKAGIYILQKQHATSAPNLVFTTDFHTFQPLSDIQPQQVFNWLTAELVRWPIPSAGTGTGILYKPEDFDPNKRYPVIFTYYEERSNELHLFPSVRLSTGALTIAWYVSNGYLVFVPDIVRPTGQNGPAILNTVESAARYLSSRPYVNAARLGLQGHSFGGYETNYIIAHSNLFAAAQSSAAPADLLGLHGGLGFSGRSYHYISEVGQMNQGAAPWEDVSLYVQGSPVVYAQQINTPLLMMHNKEDGAVPFLQSVALFNALRRLGKPVWLVEYEGEGHVLYDWESQVDFTRRQEEFFGRWLKGEEISVGLR